MNSGDPPPGDSPTGEDNVGSEDPVAIGPYRLLRLLGEGGMGRVYEAEQTEPVRRRVALKIIKLGMDTRQVVARFEAERQALAVMSHPHIAAIHDGGSTPLGRPYFVMELVHGVSITEYCDTHRLTVPERLDLFLAVCEAVHHAHQKGIIHRDLKPSNVLVTVDGDRPVPKVIDFGLAKALGTRLTDRTLVTELGMPMGTPDYMSPEQAEATGLDVDTRSDIYALGVMLYELLVGALPIEVGRRRERGGVMRYMVREEDAPTPSRRFESLQGVRETVALRRRTDPGSLMRELRSDLDWIVMRAIEKDRTRRYDSVAALAADIERHQRGEPVLARPPTVRYRAGKFARRHWAGVAAAALAFLALTVGATAATVGLVRARTAERVALTEAETAQQVSEFVMDLFRVSSPGEALGNTITAREILDRGAVEVRARLEDQPAVRARMMAVIGAVYRSLGLYSAAEPLLSDALLVQERVLGSAHPDVVGTLMELCVLARSRGQNADAVDFGERALAIAMATHGPDHARTATVHQGLGMAYRDSGEFDEARHHLDRAIEIRERLMGPNDLSTAAGLAQLGWLHRMMGDYQAARAVFERVTRIAEDQLPANHPDLASYLSDLGVVLGDLGDSDEARSLYDRALAIRTTSLGPEHVEVGHTLNNLGGLEWNAGNLDLAQEHYESALTVFEQAMGPESAAVAMILGNLALVAQGRRDYVHARELYEQALPLEEALRGPAHPRVSNLLGNYGWLLRSIGEFDRAREVLERALALRADAFGPDNPNVRSTHTNLAYLFRDMGNYQGACDHARQALAIAEATYPPASPAVGHDLALLGSTLVLAGDHAAAAPVLERVRTAFPDREEAVLSLATLHHRQGHLLAADSLFDLWLSRIAKRDGGESASYAVGEAVVWVIRGDRERAVASLGIAVDRGYADPWFVRHYGLIDLRSDPRYLRMGSEVLRRAGL